MEDWKALMKFTVRRRLTHFQRSRRALSLYILVCVLLSCLTLCAITLRLYDRLFFVAARRHIVTNTASSTKLLAGPASTLLQPPPPPGTKISSLQPGPLASPEHLAPHAQKHRVYSGDSNALQQQQPKQLPQPVVSSAILAWDYHHNTTRPRRMFNCGKLVQADLQEQHKFLKWSSRHHQSFATVAESAVPEMTLNCSAFRRIRAYKSTPGSQLEREYPIAHVILVHRRFEHLERLVRALYMPQHSFCIHVDSKAPESLKQAVAAFARCFDNVYLAPRPQRILYAHVSRLVADIVCMEELLRRDASWKYLINYASTELPIRTNLETVQILQAMHGLNDIHETYKKRVVSRFNRVYEVVKGNLKATKKVISPVPHNITIVKGQAYNTFSRSFLEWLFKDQRPRDLLVWSAQTYSPDEHYWGTLNDLYHNSHLDSPGGFRGDPETKGYLTKFILWAYKDSRFKCNGRAVHNICNFNALDLPTIVSQHHLAANKYDLTLDPVAYACMEELLENRTLTPDPSFDKRKYESLYFIRSSLRKNKKKKTPR